MVTKDQRIVKSDWPRTCQVKSTPHSYILLVCFTSAYLDAKFTVRHQLALQIMTGVSLRIIIAGEEIFLMRFFASLPEMQYN